MRVMKYVIVALCGAAAVLTIGAALAPREDQWGKRRRV